MRRPKVKRRPIFAWHDTAVSAALNRQMHEKMTLTMDTIIVKQGWIGAMPNSFQISWYKTM